MEAACDGPEMANNKDEDARRRKLSLKVQKLKLRRSLNQHRSYPSSGYNIGAVYELRLRKLRKNNKALAKALADQKMEAQQLYSEGVALKGELQECHERLLRLSDKNSEAITEHEVERRLKEIREPLNAAISQAMENLVAMVQNMTTVKQLASAKNATSSRSSSSSFSFPRSSGSRAPLGSCGNTSSPCRSVRPMVSGHVLQPAMVAIEKLDDVWKARVKERIQAREEEAMDMSTIGEQSGLSVEDGNDSTSQDDMLSSSQSPSEPANNSLEESRVLSVSPRLQSSPGRRGRQSDESSQSAPPSPVVSARTSPTATVSPILGKCGDDKRKSANKTQLEHDEDPLEGASWWYSDSDSSRRGKGRGRGRGGGRKRGRPKSSVGVSSPLLSANRSSLEASSESEEEELTRKRTKVQSYAENKEKVVKNPTTPPESPVQVFEHSYLASPATMLTRLENLEAKSGRRSKSKSKGRSLRVSACVPDNAHKQQQQSRGNSPSKIRDLDTLTSSDSVVDNDSPAVELESEEPEHMPPPPPPRIESDYLIKDSDLTCIVDMSMDMTEPISKILSQAAAELKNREANGELYRNMNNDKRFFKNQMASESQTSGSPEKTPFDLSLMDASCVTIPPYSSQKTLEKENMPPESDSNDSKEDKEETQEEKEGVGLRMFSIILEDVMKSAEGSPSGCHNNALGPSRKMSESPNGIKTESESIKKNRSSRNKKKNLNFSRQRILEEEEDDDDEAEEEEESWSPGKVKKNKNTERRGSSQKGRKSVVMKKRNTGTLSPTRKQRKRKNKSESSVVLIAKEVEGNIKKSIELEGVENADVTKGLSDCYVKILRTTLNESGRKSATAVDNCISLDGSDDELPDFGVHCNNVQASGDGSETKDKYGNPVTLMNLNPTNTMQVVADSTEPPATVDVATNSREAMAELVVLEEDDEVAGLGNSLRKSVDVLASHGNDDCPLKPTADAEVETEAPRRRRGAAMKILSFKEPTLNKKMRQAVDKVPGSVNSVPTGTKTKADRKSGRKSTTS